MTAAELYRIAAIHICYTALVGGGLWFWLRRSGIELGLLESVICGLPALLEIVLTFTSQEDQEQYFTRLAAAAMFTPILLLFWANSVGLTGLQMAAGGFVHMLCFAGAVLWLGTTTTRVQPAPGVAPVDSTTLQARLLSLNDTGAPLHVTADASGELTVLFRYHVPDRSYRLLLNLDSSTQQVRVRERASANLATPISENERSMRGPGQPLYDATRPDAQKVSESVAQTTIIRPAQLAATPSSWQGTSVLVPAAFAQELDERGVATLLCAVVTRSGWHWRPAFFGAR